MMGGYVVVVRRDAISLSVTLSPYRGPVIRIGARRVRLWGDISAEGDPEASSAICHSKPLPAGALPGSDPFVAGASCDDRSAWVEAGSMERLTQVRTGACFGRLVGSVDVWRVGVSGEALRGVTTNRACFVPRIRIWQTEGCLRCEFATATGIGACEAGTWNLGRQDCDPFGASAGSSIGGTGVGHAAAATVTATAGAGAGGPGNKGGREVPARPAGHARMAVSVEQGVGMEGCWKPLTTGGEWKMPVALWVAPPLHPGG
ncbi:hypothetical protein Purlil1_5099 [Purpureocillium lilacinum]|uniref:Uncharacterized protein n=1 Tax=Purpureocillium lilacinum TaxID=33203 RepID=A0ABR0C2B7_PURLI|nr:hypothetical protein Purlil1_5099 [Purpureocillium lilacinum]